MGHTGYSTAHYNLCIAFEMTWEAMHNQKTYSSRECVRPHVPKTATQFTTMFVVLNERLQHE